MSTIVCVVLRGSSLARSPFRLLVSVALGFILNFSRWRGIHTPQKQKKNAVIMPYVTELPLAEAGESTSAAALPIVEGDEKGISCPGGGVMRDA
jgi:hypothetical protein